VSAPYHRHLLTAALLTLAGCAALAGCSTSASLLREPTGGALTEDSSRLILVVLDNSIGALRPQAGSTPRAYDRTGPYAIGDQARAAASELAHTYHLAPLREWPIAALKVDCLVFGLPPHADRATVLRQLSLDQRVRLAQPLQQFSTMASEAPAAATAAAAASAPYNDPYLGLQWGFAALDAAPAQRFSSGRGVSVAVIDTGADIDHPDLAGRIAHVRNFVDHDARAFSSDRHGTLVSGVIAAVPNNGLGIAGIAPAVRLDIFKTCEPVAPGSLAAQCNSFTLALALSAAIDAHAQIVNLSLGGPADPLLTELVERGERRGMMFVGAVPPNGRMDGFPLGIPGVLAAQQSDVTPASDAVLPAPGREVLSLAPGGYYDFASGSSLAAAHVSAALALLRAALPRADTAMLRSALLQSRARVGAHGRSINICGALAIAQPRDLCPSEHVPALLHVSQRKH